MKTNLKKVSIKLVAKETFSKDLLNVDSVVTINEYEETVIKHDDFMSNYSFEFLKDSAIQFGQGCWLILKGFGGMSMWSVISIAEALKHLWKMAFGGNKDGK